MKNKEYVAELRKLQVVVKLSTPVGEIVGRTEKNEPLVTGVTMKLTVCVVSPGPAEIAVAQPGSD